MSTKTKVLFSIPLQESLSSSTHLAACRILADQRFDVTHTCSKGYDKNDNRSRVAEEFLNGNYDFLLSIDSDVTPLGDPLTPIDLDLDVVGFPTLVWAGKRDDRPPVYWGVYQSNGNGYSPIRGGSGIVEVDAVSFSCVLIARRVVKAFTAPFTALYNEDGIQVLGEDLNFCKQAQEYGYKVHAYFGCICDHYKTVSLLEIYQALFPQKKTEL